MSETFDFVVVGGGSAGAVIASRLTEDPLCRVALIEAGERPPAVSSMPVACASMQLNPETDWMYTADPGKAGLGLNGRRMPVPRGKMLGGSSSINYMMYVRGHPATSTPGPREARRDGATTMCCRTSARAKHFVPSDEAVIDAQAHNSDGPLGVSI
jgi:choline dehydrogenase-like flavoprotein